MIARGYEAMVYVPWIVVHVSVIVTGLGVLRTANYEASGHYS
jgi:hypothetical protein